MRSVRLFWCLLLSALLASPLAAVTRRMFITSVTGTGNLSTWADAGGFTGLGAGDAICQARAAAAGLPNSAGYRAWLSDSVDDAYCRMHNLGSKRATNCGQPTLPAAAGPWWRTDGEPFGAALPDLVAPLDKVLHPPSVDEFGVALLYALAWTGTSSDGSASASTCLDWSSAGADATKSGTSYQTATSWTVSGDRVCSTSLPHLYCFETGVADPLPPLPAWGRLAFLTSTHGMGDLGAWPEAEGATGVAAGDGICRNVAAAAGIRHADAFKAWLSADGSNAIDRFAHDGPWMRLDGVEVAAGKQDLTDGTLESPINLTETGSYLGNWAVWTGTVSNGSPSPANCANWESDAVSESGEWGQANTSIQQWTDIGEIACDFGGGKLYCLQDLPLLFLDGFESAGTQAWTMTVP